jgi:hypothetical protein
MCSAALRLPCCQMILVIPLLELLRCRRRPDGGRGSRGPVSPAGAAVCRGPAGSCQHIAFVQRRKASIAVVRPGAAGRLARGVAGCVAYLDSKVRPRPRASLEGVGAGGIFAGRGTGPLVWLAASKEVDERPILLVAQARATARAGLGWRCTWPLDRGQQAVNGRRDDPPPGLGVGCLGKRHLVCRADERLRGAWAMV